MHKAHREHKHSKHIEDRHVHASRKRGIERVLQKGNKKSEGSSGSMAGGMRKSGRWSSGSDGTTPAQG